MPRSVSRDGQRRISLDAVECDQRPVIGHELVLGEQRTRQRLVAAHVAADDDENEADAARDVVAIWVEYLVTLLSRTLMPPATRPATARQVERGRGVLGSSR